MNKATELVFIDLETTGIEEKDRLLQVAYKYPGSHTFCEYFKPGVPINIEAMAVCHITEKMVADKPTFKGSDMYHFLQAELGEGPSILVAHNAEFDMKFLKREGIEAKPHICTLKLIHDYDKECKLTKHNMQYLRYYFRLKGLEEVKPHDARSDVLVLEALYDQVLSKHYTLEQMIEISARPIVYQKMMFGKHRGKFFRDIVKEDCNYLLWLKREGTNIDENLMYTLNHYIDRRVELS